MLEYDYIFSVDEVINEERLNDVPKAFMPRSHPCPSTTDLPSPTSSPIITIPPVQMQVLRRTTRNVTKSYGGIIVRQPSGGVGKGGEIFFHDSCYERWKQEVIYYQLSVIVSL